MVGIGLGFYFLQTLDEKTLRRGLGAFGAVFDLCFMGARISPVLPPQWRGALAAGAGMPEVFWSSVRRWSWTNSPASSCS